MATIDLIVLGMIKNGPVSAYDIQKAVEYRHISQWVKISTPSVYKKVIQLEEKQLITRTLVKDGNMAEKALYSLTAAGEKEFSKLMRVVADEPVDIFLDFNAVVVNLYHLPPDEQLYCLEKIREHVAHLKKQLGENLTEKKNVAGIPETGMAVLRQQYLLAGVIEEWIQSVGPQGE
jgi:DNA-binding PadR family transcriptional regulator